MYRSPFRPLLRPSKSNDAAQLRRLPAILSLSRAARLRLRRAFRLFDHKSRDGSIVVYRIRVWHCTDCRESAGDRGCCAAGNRFFIFVTRLAQMDMRVDEAWGDD